MPNAQTSLPEQPMNMTTWGHKPIGHNMTLGWGRLLPGFAGYCRFVCRRAPAATRHASARRRDPALHVHPCGLRQADRREERTRETTLRSHLILLRSAVSACGDWHGSNTITVTHQQPWNSSSLYSVILTLKIYWTDPYLLRRPEALKIIEPALHLRLYGF